MQIKGSRGLLYRKPFLNLTSTALIWSAWSDLLLSAVDDYIPKKPSQEISKLTMDELRSNLTLSTKETTLRCLKGLSIVRLMIN